MHKKHAGWGETCDSGIPAEAGIHKVLKKIWTPVFTGVTVLREAIGKEDGILGVVMPIQTFPAPFGPAIISSS